MKDDKMYNYTQHDLLITPEKYQMSQFQGKKFLDDYRKNRLKIMFKAENLNNQELLNHLSQINDLRQFGKKIDSNKIVIKNFLSQLLITYIDTQSISYIDIFDKLLKKFENKKKIFSIYNNSFLEISPEYNDIENYILFSLCCNIFYLFTGNLRYLNSALKVNDLIISTNNHSYNLVFKKLLIISLQMELNNVKILCEKKGFD